MFIDTHAHYNDERYDDDRDALLASFPPNGVVAVINSGSDMSSSRISVQLAEQFSFVYASVGIHPLNNQADFDVAALTALARHPKCVALGEMGLDYHYPDTDRAAQRACFVAQLRLAESLDKPVVLHSRDATEETLDMVKRSDVRRGVLHCFSGSLETAWEYIDLGFHIGIGGVVTFGNAKKCREVVEAIPLSRLLLETDAPYLAPEPFRGKRNQSDYLAYIARAVSIVRGITPEEVAQTTTANAKALFGLNL